MHKWTNRISRENKRKEPVFMYEKIKRGFNNGKNERVQIEKVQKCCEKRRIEWMQKEEGKEQNRKRNGQIRLETI